MPDASVSLTGNVTRDPELKYLANGTANCRFGVAVNRRWQDKQGDWQEETSYFDVVCWRDLAENVVASLGKGTRVVVTGRPEQRSWEDTKTGQKRSTVEIIADEVGPSLRWATCRVEKTERSGGRVTVPSQPLFDEEDDQSPF
jgi:single-strand DNA-binding protein